MANLHFFSAWFFILFPIVVHQIFSNYLIATEIKCLEKQTFVTRFSKNWFGAHLQQLVVATRYLRSIQHTVKRSGMSKSVCVELLAYFSQPQTTAAATRARWTSKNLGFVVGRIDPSLHDATIPTNVVGQINFNCQQCWRTQKKNVLNILSTTIV